MMNSPPFPVTKSFLSQAALAETITAAYGLSDVRCQLLTATMRDVYRVSSDRQDYIFFIYRHNQRTLDEIKAEWQFVAYLAVVRGSADGAMLEAAFLGGYEQIPRSPGLSARRCRCLKPCAISSPLVFRR